jgi:hypothetical protein
MPPEDERTDGSTTVTTARLVAASDASRRKRNSPRGGHARSTRTRGECVGRALSIPIPPAGLSASSTRRHADDDSSAGSLDARPKRIARLGGRRLEARMAALM